MPQQLPSSTMSGLVQCLSVKESGYMLRLSTKRTIEINGEECLVTCVHQYQEVWIATGVFDGKFLHQNGSSEELAFAMWEKEARSFLNLL